MLKEIITKWLGEEKDEIKLIGDVGHNALIQDLKSRIPELEEMMVGIIESFRDRDLPEEEKWQCNILIDDIINTLKGVK